MHATKLLIAALIGWFAAVAFVSQSHSADMPYQAEVVGEQATAHCGPGEGYYATDRLSKEARVEVYRHTDDGWCAIRPSEESFSLIPSNQVRLADGDSLAEVIDEKAVSWIGTSTAEPEQMLWQVKLKVGEVVEIIGIVRRDNLAGTEKDLWYKIRPPAGEFRYVHRNQLKRIANNETAVDGARHAVAEQPVRVASHETEITQQNDATKPTETPDLGWRVTRSPRARPSSGEPSERVAVLEPTLANRTDVEVNTNAITPTASRGDLDIDATLAALQVDLVQLAAQPLNEWDFSSIESRLAELDQAETTTRQRTQMVRYRERLKKFVALKQQRDTLAEPAAEVATALKAVAQPAETAPSEPSFATADANPNLPIGTGVIEPVEPIGATEEPLPAEYDGVGYLMPVISREQQAPPFALLDKKGNVLGFVSPQPGLNLRRYVKQEVGVIGQRGYLPRYQATHLTAQRIIVLDRHR